MRYGILKVSLDYLEDILCISNDVLIRKERRVTELPDDAHIIGVEFDSVQMVVKLLVAGSGKDLYKIPRGSVVPTIDMAMEHIEEV